MFALLTLAALAQEPSSEHFILHGDAPPVGAVPEAGALIVQASAFGLTIKLFYCSASLIAPDVVLTAAHCIEPERMAREQYGVELDAAELYFTRQPDVSAFSLTSGERPELPPDAAHAHLAIAHPDWVGATNLIGPLGDNYDVAVLFLDRPRFDQPLAVLPTAAEAALLTQGDPVELAGWGQQNADSGPTGQLRWAHTTVGEMSATELQTGPLATDPHICFGDSGGPTFWSSPLAAPGTGPRRQIGVTSHTWDDTGCANAGGVSTRVDFYLDWLDQTLRDGCANGTRSWCDPDPLQQGVIPPRVPEEAVGGCTSAPVGVGWWLVVVAAGMGRRRRGAIAVSAGGERGW